MELRDLGIYLILSDKYVSCFNRTYSIVKRKTYLSHMDYYQVLFNLIPFLETDISLNWDRSLPFQLAQHGIVVYEYVDDISEKYKELCFGCDLEGALYLPNVLDKTQEKILLQKIRNSMDIYFSIEWLNKQYNMNYSQLISLIKNDKKLVLNNIKNDSLNSH